MTVAVVRDENISDYKSILQSISAGIALAVVFNLRCDQQKIHKFQFVQEDTENGRNFRYENEKEGSDLAIARSQLQFVPR